MSWDTYNFGKITGIIISKEHVIGRHMAKGLAQWKDEKYDLKIHWFKQPWNTKENHCVMENWQDMVVSHVQRNYEWYLVLYYDDRFILHDDVPIVVI